MSESSLEAQELYRSLPSVDSLLHATDVAPLVQEYGHDSVVTSLRELLEDVRTQIAAGSEAPSDPRWGEMLRSALMSKTTASLLPVINATGVIIHTNLGRAPLSANARKAVGEVALAYSNLEYSLGEGVRGSRHDHARERLVSITGAEDAMVVNNNAGAVFLALAALCYESEVVVSRGQLVEIGGGFRIPDVLRHSGACLVEVGTTNRTHVHDYENALGSETSAIMRIHSSNFKQIGFVTEPSLADLVRVADEARALGLSVFVIDDLGSGTLFDTSDFGLAAEPMVQESLDAGADIVTFSGDKLLGGPQAGIILGRAELIAQIRRHPLARALRVDKMTLAALDATLLSYQRGRALAEVPVWQMISADSTALHMRVEHWQSELSRRVSGFDCEIGEGESAIGGGSLPGETLPTYLLTIRRDDAEELSAALRNGKTPVVCRIQQDHLLFDPRSILPEQDEDFLNALTSVLTQNADRNQD